MYMVIEMKQASGLLEGKGLEQAYDYTLALRAAQGHKYLIYRPCGQATGSGLRKWTDGDFLFGKVPR